MAAQYLTILLIEDNPGDARLLQEFLLDASSLTFSLEHVDRLSQGLQRLQEENFDIVLLDLSLPDTQGFDTFVKLHSCAYQVPIIVITGLNDETLALRAVQEGAQDYLVKGQLSSDLLSRSIRYAIERKRTEQKIRQQAALLDIATDAILVRDLQNQILFWNKGAEHLYGWSATEALGKQINTLLYPKPSVQFAAAQKILLAQGEWSGELQQITKSGQEVTVESRWTLMRDATYQPKSILVVSTNITEKKKLEAQFLRAQRMESLGTLASGIAHDLNTILTPILSTAQLLQMKFPNVDERNQQLFKLLEVNAKRGATLVQQVLSFARGIEGERTILQIKQLIEEIHQGIVETFPDSITTQVEIAPDLWAIAGNATQLHQVFMNLCINARDAMPEGGTLSLTAQNLLVSESYTRTNLDAKAGSFIVVTVSDTGTGIPPDVLDRVFEPFFTTKEFGKGTGLGLSTAIGIIKSHGGFVNVTSEIDQGTQFKLFLPAVLTTERWEASPSEVPSGNDELVLIVNNETTVLESHKAVLEAYNYRVLTAVNGTEAISLYAQHQKEIRLVLVDMMMPLMEGILTIRMLREINAQVNIVVIGGLKSDFQITIALDSGIQNILLKPYTMQDLVKTVNHALCA